MKLNETDTANFTLLQRKYKELRCLVGTLSDHYFTSCITTAPDTQDEKNRLEFCSRALDDLHIPLDKALRILNNTLHIED